MRKTWIRWFFLSNYLTLAASFQSFDPSTFKIVISFSSFLISYTILDNHWLFSVIQPFVAFCFYATGYLIISPHQAGSVGLPLQLLKTRLRNRLYRVVCLPVLHKSSTTGYQHIQRHLAFISYGCSLSYWWHKFWANEEASR